MTTMTRLWLAFCAIACLWFGAIPVFAQDYTEEKTVEDAVGGGLTCKTWKTRRHYAKADEDSSRVAVVTAAVDQGWILTGGGCSGEPDEPKLDVAARLRLSREYAVIASYPNERSWVCVIPYPPKESDEPDEDEAASDLYAFATGCQLSAPSTPTTAPTPLTTP